MAKRRLESSPKSRPALPYDQDDDNSGDEFLQLMFHERTDPETVMLRKFANMGVNQKENFKQGKRSSSGNSSRSVGRSKKQRSPGDDNKTPSESVKKTVHMVGRKMTIPIEASDSSTSPSPQAKRNKVLDCSSL